MSTNGVRQTDESIDTLYAWFPPQTPGPQPLPEAAFSITLKGRVDGQDALLTIRGMTPEAFQANLAAVRGLLDAPVTPPALPQGQGKEWCAVHGTKMVLQTKEGRQWHSHKTADGAWCKGKGVRA
jgi:hypothetical protein